MVGLGNSIRGSRGGIQRRGGSSSGNYNPNINVTGNDMSQGQSPPPKPWRGGLRGRGSSFQGPSRPGPPNIAPNHQNPGMMQPGGNFNLFCATKTN